jgi:hypothetical protein
MRGKAKYVGLERGIAVFVHKFHIQDQRQMVVEWKSTSIPPQPLVISSLPSYRSIENPPEHQGCIKQYNSFLS